MMLAIMKASAEMENGWIPVIPVKPFKNLTEQSIILPHKNLTQGRHQAGDS
jgi:hypothetical protein